MDIKVIYTKDFSEIENIQSSERVYYNLLIQKDSEETVVYGIELVSSNNSQMENQVIEGVSESEVQALNIIKFLYENAVKPGEFVGIVNDLIGPMC